MDDIQLTPEQENLWNWANEHLYGLEEEEASAKAKKGNRFNSEQLSLLLEYWSIIMGYSVPNLEEDPEEDPEEENEEDEEDPADQLGLSYYGDEH